MFYTYIIHSKSKDRYYTGYASDIRSRLEKHNSGSTSSTKSGIPWELAYYEEFSTKSEAIKRENQIKKMKSRKYIEKLLAGGRPE